MFGLAGWKLYGIAGLLAAALLGVVYMLGRSDGYAACEEAKLEAVIRQAASDADAHSAAEDLNTKIVIEDAKAEEKNDAVEVKITKSIGRMPVDGNCGSVEWVQNLRELR